MSGHSKWHSIKHKKGAADAKRGKIFTKHAKLIAIAARRGGDPNMNPNLRTAIINAKADNVPSANIEKAVKKGSGEDKDAAILEEIMYEGHGPQGTALLIEVITDNRNRALTNIKTVMAKHGGNLGAAGSVSWMFEKKGLIFARVGVGADGLVGTGNDAEQALEQAELKIIDAGAEDLSKESDPEKGDYFEIITDPVQVMQVRNNLEKAGFEIEKAGIAYLPKNTVKIADPEKSKKVLDLLEALEEDEDVSEIYVNCEMAETVN